MGRKNHYTTKKYRNSKYRSGLEKRNAEHLNEHDVDFEYEPIKIEYKVPARKSRYKPDFILPNGIIVETKGRFTASNRKKHSLVKEQYPELDIRFVFSNSNSKIRKGSKTSYGEWCEKHGFQYADKKIPEEWWDEPGPDIDIQEYIDNIDIGI